MRTTCSVDGCEQPVVGQGWCRKHYSRWYRKGDVGDERKNARQRCTEEGCDRWRVGDGLCELHYRRARRPAIRAANPKLPIPAQVCPVCGDNFTPYRRGRGVYCSRKCKEVAYIASGKARAAVRKHYFKSNYELNLEQLEDIAKGHCDICGTQDWGGRHGRPAIDHDHKTGAVRGVLCHRCNVAIGHLRDDPALATAACRYLTDPPGLNL